MSIDYREIKSPNVTFTYEDVCPKTLNLVITKVFSKTGFAIHTNNEDTMAIALVGGEEPNIQLPNGWYLYGIYPCGRDHSYLREPVIRDCVFDLYLDPS